MKINRKLTLAVGVVLASGAVAGLTSGANKKQGRLGSDTQIKRDPNASNSQQFRDWFQAASAKAYPSPLGNYWSSDNLQEADIFADNQAKVSTGRVAAGRSGVVEVSGDFASGAIIAFDKFKHVPATDGEPQRIWMRFYAASSGRESYQLTPVLIRDKASFALGSTVTVDRPDWKPLLIDLGKTRELLERSTKQPIDLSCKSPEFKLGLKIQKTGPGREKGGSIFLDDVALGILAKCCPEVARGDKPGRPQEKEVTKKLCCDDASLPFEMASKDSSIFNIKPPKDADEDFEPYAEVVNEDLGDVGGLFGGIDPKSTSWLDKFPCNKAIGGMTDSELKSLIEGALQEDGTKDEVEDSKSTEDAVGKTEKEMGETDLEKELGASDKVGMPTPPASSNPWVYTRSSDKAEEWAFYPGADIVYVHGLKMDHLKDLLFLPGNKERWVSKPDFDTLGERQLASRVKWDDSASPSMSAAAANPAFYDPNGGYFKLGADWYWTEGENNVNDGHTDVFLDGLGPGKSYVNRYMTVAYSCNDSAKNAAKALLRQLADAMRFGTGVVNRKNPLDKGGFGSRGLVIVSHSTGGLVTNIAMQLGKRNLNWGADWVVNHVKLHVAANSAMTGSRLASAAFALATIYDGLGGGINPATAALVYVLKEAGLPLPTAPGTATPILLRTILVDLVPTVAYNRWGRLFRNDNVPGGVLDFRATNPGKYVPPTVCLPTNHPTEFAPLKYTNLLLGLDDGVTNANSASGNPTGILRWPSGFVGPPGQNFDMGIFVSNFDKVRLTWRGVTLTLPVAGSGLGHKKRAIRYTVDMHDTMFAPVAVAINPDLIAPRVATLSYLAAGPNYRLSPTGMLQTVSPTAIPGSSPPRTYESRVMDRYPNMFTAIASAADHYDGTIGSSSRVSWPNYQATNASPDQQNFEETFVVGENDLGVYDQFSPPAFRNIAGLSNSSKTGLLDRPVLNSPLSQHLHVRGIRVTFKLFGKVRSFWIVKRYYLLLAGTEQKSMFDYVYWSYLGGGR